MKLLIELPDTSIYNSMYKAICENGYIYDEDNETIAKAIKDGVLIPADATNGDVIKVVFPDCEDWKATITPAAGTTADVHFAQLPNNMTINKFDESWWTAPYRRG